MAVLKNTTVDTTKQQLSATKFVLRKYHFREGVNTPNFKSIAKVDLPLNGYENNQRTVWQQPVISSKFWLLTQTTTLVGWGYSSGTQAESNYTSWAAEAKNKLPSEATLLNEAITRCLNQVSDAKLNLPVSIAEARKTQNMILDTAKTVYRAYSQVRRGRFVEAARTLNITPRKSHTNWLAYKYGWMPLLMEVKGAAELYAQQFFDKPIRFSKSAKASAKADYTYSITGSNGGWYSRNKSFFQGSYTSERTVVVRVRVLAVNQNLSTLQQMGLTNPALVVWELVPYSFVFDWFLSVGQYLQAVSALHGLTLERSMKCVSTNTKGTHLTGEASNYDVSGRISESGFVTYHGGSESLYKRSFCSISEGLSPVRNRDPLDWNRCVTGLALLRSRSGS